MLPFSYLASTSNMEVMLFVIFPMASPKLWMFARMRSSSVGTHFGALRCTQMMAGSSLVWSIIRGSDVVKTVSPSLSSPFNASAQVSQLLKTVGVVMYR